MEVATKGGTSEEDGKKFTKAKLPQGSNTGAQKRYEVAYP